MVVLPGLQHPRAFLYRSGSMNRKLFRLALAVLVVAALPGCSSDSGKRAVYESLQNREQQDCLKDPSYPTAWCPKRERYDDYQRQRKALEAK
jgi:hypothetical protein